MADPRRMFTIYIDTENVKRVRYDSTGTSPAFYDATPIIVLRKQQMLIRCHLMMPDATTYFIPGAGVTWYFGMDSVYTSGHADIVQVANANFIAADWASADFANGKVCWRVDLSGADLATDMGTSASKIYHSGLWMTPSGGEITPIVEFDITVLNIATAIP